MPSLIKSINPNSYLSLLLLGILGVVGLSGLMILPIFIGVYVDFLGYSEQQAGWVTGVNLLGIALMTLVFSLKAKHWQLYPTVVIGLISMVVFDYLSISASQIYEMSAYRFISGLGGGAVQACVAAALARTKKSEIGFSIYIACQFVLPGVAFYFLPNFINQYEVKGVFSLLILMQLVLIPLSLVIKNYSLDASVKDKKENEWELISSRPALLSLSALCFYGIANAGLYAYIERIGLVNKLNDVEVGEILGIVNLVSIVGAMLVFVLTDRFGHFRPLFCGITLQVIAMLIILMGGQWGYISGVVLWSVAWAFCWPYFLSMQANIDSSGTVVTAGQFTNLIGNSLGPILFGFFLSGSNYSYVLLVAIVAFVASLLPMAWIHKSAHS